MNGFLPMTKTQGWPPLGMFGWIDFRVDGKKKRENGRERNLLRCLVRRENERDFAGTKHFLSSPTKLQSLENREKM